MERITVFMVKTSMAYFALGFVLGAVLLIAKGIGVVGLTAILLPTHTHALLVGWLLQFVMGIAYWILPRRRTAKQPLGFSGQLAFTVYGMLNAGLVLRIIFEPVQALRPDVSFTGAALAVSGVLQAGAGLLWIHQVWQRARPLAEVRERALQMMEQSGAPPEQKP